MVDHLEKIYSFFDTSYAFKNGELFGSGHIHETYRIETVGDNNDDYILQKLNNNVFRNIPEMQENILRVTDHIRNKLRKKGEKEIDRKCLTPIQTTNGESYIIDEYGSFWRMFIYIPDHRTYDIVDSPVKAYHGGRAVGHFQALLSDFPEPPLHETIPFFHNVEKRLEAFHSIIKSDPTGRVKSSTNEILFVKERQEKMKLIIKLGETGLIPIRITHNDTKINNVLFDLNDSVLCMIDLDTVMPGYVHYDFGDAIRTTASTAAEDEKDLSIVGIDLDLFTSFSKGYLEETFRTLNTTEIENLAISPIIITFIMGLRFLTDYLGGDTYYKIHYDDHNLVRAKAQFKLVEIMEARYGEMKNIIELISRDLLK